MKNRVFQETSQDELLVKKIVGFAMKIHRSLGCGFLETVYRNALVLELRKANINFECHPTLSVIYEDVEVGIFQADIIVEKKLIVELKAVEALNSAHASQLINYLAATKINDGLLLNFGSTSLEFRTKTRLYHKNHQPSDLQE